MKKLVHFERKNSVIFLSVVTYPSDQRQPPPHVVTAHQSVLLPRINQLVLEVATPDWTGKIIWSVIAEKIAQDIQNDYPQLGNWLATNPTQRGTFLKTLYLSQLSYCVEWDDIVEMKGGHTAMLLGMNFQNLANFQR